MSSVPTAPPIESTPRRERVERHVRILADRGVDLRAALDAWLTRSTTEDRNRDAAGERAAAENVALPAQGPLYFAGMDPPWLLRRAAMMEMDRNDGPQRRLVVVEPDPQRLLDALASTDLDDLLAHPRLALFAGPDAYEALAADLADRIDTDLAAGDPDR